MLEKHDLHISHEDKERLREAVRKLINEGYKKEQIKTALIKAGWDKEFIHKFFAHQK